MSRLELSDSFQDIVTKFSEGNPGAMNVLFELNPNDLMNFIPNIMVIDNMQLYGSQLYMLWNDSCNRDTTKFKRILKLYKEGKITDKDIYERVKTQGYAMSFDDLLYVGKD